MDDSTIMNTQYIDITWLTTFGLNSLNALDYFYSSPFYDPHCNNEIIRSQGLASTHLQALTGVEYALDLQSSKEPHLYVIKKQIRRSRNIAETLEVFYCLDGIIYQCPVFLEVIQSRLAKASLALKKSFNDLQDIMNDESCDELVRTGDCGDA